MIWDGFLYNGEEDILSIRMAELSGLDIKHVIVEGDYTFTGKPKEFLLPEHLIDHPNVIYIQVFDMPNNGNPWDNEKFLRNAIMRGMDEAQDDDICLISDVDEIPKASCIGQYLPQYGHSAIQMDMHSYWLNCIQGRQSWNMARIMPFSYLKERSPQEVRHSGFLMTIFEGGWHLTWIGGVDAMLKKFESFSHQEESTQKIANHETLERKMATGESLWSENSFWEFVPIDDRMPRYIRENQHLFQHLIKN